MSHYGAVKDENIHPDRLLSLIGPTHAKQMEDWALALYSAARTFALARGLIIADTKFEFGVAEDGELMLVDEVLTPGMPIPFLIFL